MHTPHLTAKGKLRLGGGGLPGRVPFPQGGFRQPCVTIRPRDSVGCVVKPRHPHPPHPNGVVLGCTGRAAPGCGGGRGERHMGAPMGPPVPGAGEQPLPPPVPAWPPWSPWVPGAPCRRPPGSEVRHPPALRPGCPQPRVGGNPAATPAVGVLGWLVPGLGTQGWMVWLGGGWQTFPVRQSLSLRRGGSVRVVGWGSGHPHCLR